MSVIRGMDKLTESLDLLEVINYALLFEDVQVFKDSRVHLSSTLSVAIR